MAAAADFLAEVFFEETDDARWAAWEPISERYWMQKSMEDKEAGWHRRGVGGVERMCLTAS